MEHARSEFCVDREDRGDWYSEVSAPYSILAQSATSRFEARLIRDAAAVHAELAAIAQDAAARLADMLAGEVSVVSLADSWAAVEILGAARYREFVSRYQLMLLERIRAVAVDRAFHGVLHLCPRSFLWLELTARTVELSRRPYRDALRELAETGFYVVGGQCIHTEFSEKIVIYEA
jgi:hypothetical protein